MEINSAFKGLILISHTLSYFVLPCGVEDQFILCIFVLFFVYHHLIYLEKVKLLLSKIKNTELLACAVSFQFPGDSENGDDGSDND